MSNNCLAGFPAFGPRVDTKIIYPTPNTVTLPAGTYLPVDYTNKLQVDIPITSENTLLPYCEPYKLPLSPVNGPSKYGTPYKPLLIAQIKNNDAAARTVYWRYAATYAGSDTFGGTISVPAGYYACIAASAVFAWEYGKTDRLWFYSPSSTNVELVAVHRLIFPQFLPLLNTAQAVKDIKIDVSTDSLLGGGACYTTTASFLRASTPGLEYLNTEGNISKLAGSANATYGFVHYPWGVDSGIATVHATNPLYHWQHAYVTRIAYTPIL